MKSSSFKKVLTELSHNQIVLYLVALCALLNLVGYTMRNNLAAIALFLIIGFGSTHLTKNMILILLFAIIGTQLLVKLGLFKSLGIREGLVNKNDPDSDEEEEEEEIEIMVKKEVNNNKPKPGSKSNPSAGLTAPKPNDTDNETDKSVSKSAKLDDGADLTGTGTKVDYAKTVENAFDSLKNILESDQIRNMSNDTARLASKQEGLISAMKNMQPLMDNAQNMLQSLQGGPLASLISGEDSPLAGLMGENGPLAGLMGDEKSKKE